MIDIQIDGIKGVLPTLGEEYIEEALGCYGLDADWTLEGLLQASTGRVGAATVHPRLLMLLLKLPWRLRDQVGRYSGNVNLHWGNCRGRTGESTPSCRRSASDPMSGGRRRCRT